MPDDQQAQAHLPPGMQPLVFEQFQGINTSATRPGINDAQMWWCDGWMPLGPQFLRTLYGVAPALWTAPSTLSIVFYKFINIGALPYAIVVLSDGSIYAVRTDTAVAAQIAPASTIAAPTIGNIGISQYGAKYAIIVANQTDGYWLWDGTLLYGPGTFTPEVMLTNVGTGYTSTPTVTAVGGAGTGSSFFATMSGGVITGVSVTNPGSGYAANNHPLLFFSGGSPTAGSLSAVSVISGGSGYTSATLTVSGGGGTSATASATVANGIITGASVTGAGSGYTGTPTVTVTGTGTGAIVQAFVTTVAAASIPLMPRGIGGTTVETYSGHVWVGKGPVNTWSAPGSVQDFSSANGGGNYTSSDSWLRVKYTQFLSTNGFLYLVGDSSISYISGVQTSGSPPVTTFSLQNADPEVGTVWPDTVGVFGRNIVLANSFGAHISYGAAVTKISEALDGVYNTVPLANFGNLIPSAAKVNIFGKKVWMFLMPIIDPITQVQTNKLFMWNGKLWWVATQDIPLTYIAGQEINSVLIAWGTNGSSIYQMFAQPSTAVNKVVQSKLFVAGGIFFQKDSGRLWVLANYYSVGNPNLNVTIDNEFGVSTQVASLSPRSVTWHTVSGATAHWTTLGGAPVSWFIAGINVYDAQPVGQTGVLLGETLQTYCDDMALIAVVIDSVIATYRG